MSPSRAIDRTAPSTTGATLSGPSTGEPSITTVLTRSGLRTATTRASSPPRLWPTSTTRPPARAASVRSRDSTPCERALRAAGVEHDPRARRPRSAPAQPVREDPQRAVARHEPRDQQHRAVRRSGVRADGSRGASGAARAPTRSAARLEVGRGGLRPVRAQARTSAERTRSPRLGGRFSRSPGRSLLTGAPERARREVPAELARGRLMRRLAPRRADRSGARCRRLPRGPCGAEAAPRCRRRKCSWSAIACSNGAPT